MNGGHDGDVDGVIDPPREHSDQIDPGEPSPAVGYRRPPARTRFKKGQSGNRKGRPTGSRNFSTLFDEVLGKTISVRDGGRWRHISKAEALAKVALHGAIKGDARAINVFLLLAEKAGMLSPPPEGQAGRYGYLVVPGMATPEEWQKEVDMLEASRRGEQREDGLMVTDQKKFKICKDVVTGKVIRRPID
jgi:hypothetical protein